MEPFAASAPHAWRWDDCFAFNDPRLAFRSLTIAPIMVDHTYQGKREGRIWGENSNSYDDAFSMLSRQSWSL